ncbi:MAG: DMT family transporter [Rhodoferax sp.]|uniref:DMT family transporter n=1 Tax=Rhodoferax sp. TaxID=50421 RepID=UPI00272F8D2F|nr:DMT family transporter [Rhodoferax sp.]MDP1528036.1 DMT family transporter [Rhodoferax sp.]MDP1944037.1 DMT family transporter [Rhodoferax sp.]
MTSSHPPKVWLTEFILLGAIWGASFLFTRLGAAEFGALPTAGLRVGIAATFLLPLLLLRGQWQALSTHWKKIFFLGMLNSGIPFALYAYALLSISTGLSSLLNATVPLFGALVAWLWLKDRPHGMKILGLLIGFVGVAMLAWGKASFKPDASGLVTGWAVLACLGACLCYGLSASFTKRHLGGVPSLVIATGSQLGATLGLALPTLWLWPSQPPSSTAWLALLAVGVLCTGVAYVLFFRLVDKVGAAGSLTVTFLIPVFAVLYGVVFLGESVTAWMLICGTVILLGTALSMGLLKRFSPAQ